MAVEREAFIKWLGAIQADTRHLVVSVRDPLTPLHHPSTFYVGRKMRFVNAWGDPDDTVGTWGNPYTVQKYGRFGSIQKYTAMLTRMPEADRDLFLRPIREALDAGKRLACWCAPDVCHAHVLAAWAIRLPAQGDAVQPEAAITSTPTAPITPTPDDALARTRTAFATAS